MPRARVNVIPTSAPDDVSGLLKLVETGEIDPSRLVAILGKTEGNGCVNDFTRGFAVSALKTRLGGQRSRHCSGNVGWNRRRLSSPYGDI